MIHPPAAVDSRETGVTADALWGWVPQPPLPGWHDRGQWRDVLRFGGDSEGDWRARVTQARRFLELTAEAAPDPAWSARLNRCGIGSSGCLISCR